MKLFVSAPLSTSSSAERSSDRLSWEKLFVSAPPVPKLCSVSFSGSFKLSFSKLKLCNVKLDSLSVRKLQLCKIKLAELEFLKLKLSSVKLSKLLLCKLASSKLKLFSVKLCLAKLC